MADRLAPGARPGVTWSRSGRPRTPPPCCGRVGAAARRSTLGSVTLPRDADRHLPAYRLDPRNDWEWFVTADRAAAAGAARRRCGWLADSQCRRGARPAADLEPAPRRRTRPARACCAGPASAPTTAACVAAAAHTEHRPGVPHLASVVTRGDHRGRGLGAAVTAWLTRALLAEGTAG